MAIDIKKAFKTVVDSIDGIKNVAIVTVLGLIIIGSIMGAVTSGAIVIPTAFNAVLTTLLTTISGWFTSGVGVVTTIVALVVVVVLMALFRTKKGKKGDMA